ncbi:MAG: asparaginase [Bifidobacterium sp.]|uniref:Asparaginase n=1 Tax=Bifidobacterium fermentum TaxID=3059035 RepID=A0AB39UB81_9BIFI
MRIHVTYTGGTIGMVESNEGLVIGADMRGWLFRILSEGNEERSDEVTFTELDPLIDSANATPESWQQIIDDLREHRESADAFVVLHGTDTMGYTTAAMSYALTEFGKPVIFTGAQHPLGRIESDATANVTGALNAALSGRARGVNLFFGHHLFAGNRVTKTSSWAFEGFDSPITGPVAQSGTPWHWRDIDRTGRGWANPKPYRRHDVAVIDMVPGITATRFAAMASPQPEAVIIRAYGVGNVPSEEEGLTGAIAGLLDDQVPVVITSQCEQAEVLLGRYETGDAIARAGACSSADMTFEAVYAKTVFLLSQGLRGKELSDWMTVPIAGELTPGVA